MEENEKIQLLKERLMANSPILFLGAGFSVGAINRQGKIPKASELKDELYEKFYCSKKKPEDITKEDLEEIQQFDLGDLCNNIQQESQKRKEELKNYLVKRFQGVMPPEVQKGEDFHFLLTKYNWKRIYSLNIDDLVENIYGQKEIGLIVQNQTELKDRDAGTLELYKMHGCVNEPDLGFVFSTNEYEDTIINSDFKLQRFCEDYYDNDVIFIGTELDESDVIMLLKKYLNAGYRSRAHKYFFISPEIKLKLRQTIKNNKDYYHIPWTTERFLQECSLLKKENEEKKHLEQLLKQYSFWMLNENDKIPKYFESKLYYGNAPIWADIFDEWDFVSPNTRKKFEEVQKNNGNYVISIFGKAFVGKTVLAKRLLVEFHKNGFLSFEFDLKGYEEIELFQNYLTILPKGSKVALLIEEAALQYYNITQMVNEVSDNIERFIVITTSRRYYHSIKRHELLRCKSIEIEAANKISNDYAYVILDKLREKNRLGELSKYANNEGGQQNFVKTKGNIVDLLYTLNHGRGFQDYFLQKFDQIGLDDEYKCLFEDCCILSSLGITLYPHIFVQLLHRQITKEKLLRGLEDIIDIEEEDIKVRCSEVFEQKIITEKSSEQKRECIEKHLHCIEKRFKENSKNVWEGIFEKLLKTKALITILKIDKEDIRDLFVSIERKYDKISYYWMQRGIFLQSLNDFENAEVFLKQAQSIRPNSYQIQHALAKNMLERSLYELEKGRETLAPYYFEEGEEMILKLINSPHYSSALCYSVHTYVDIKVKYCTLMGNINEKMLNDLYLYLIQGARVNYDQYIKHARTLLHDKAKKMHLESLAKKLTSEQFNVYAKKDFIDLEMMDLD